MKSKARKDFQKQDDHSELALRKICRVICDQFPDLPRLRTIAAPGALSNKIGEYDVDSYRLTETLFYMLQSGFLIDPGFTVDAVNFKDNRNFLDETTPADMIFVAYILRHRHHRFTEIFRKTAEGEKSPATWELCTTLARNHREDKWIERARNAGTKLIVTYGGGIEVHADYFCEDHENPYHLLIASPQEECMGGFKPGLLKSLYPDYKDIDVPVAGLGFCADTDYLQSIKASMSGKTCLSRIAKNIRQERNPLPRFGL